jgi:hypothetical protein
VNAVWAGGMCVLACAILLRVRYYIILGAFIRWNFVRAQYAYVNGLCAIMCVCVPGFSHTCSLIVQCVCDVR